MTDDSSADDPSRTTIDRRRFLAVGVGASAAALSGCASSPDGETAGATDSAGGDGDDGGTGDFRLLVSDQPADIGDFDRLDVSFEYARVFPGEDAATPTGTPTANGTATAEATPTATPDATETESEDDVDDEDDAEGNGGPDDAEEEGGPDDAGGGPDDGEEGGAEGEGEGEDGEANDGDGEEGDGEGEDGGGEGGFFRLDLEGATVDLTQVVGEKAVPVFEGALDPGTYTKVELHVASVDGVVDDASVDVKVPSEKLQITKPFTIGEAGSVSFVFDINVVKRGPDNGYILKPVVSESGVAGEDVEAEEVDPEEEGDDGEDGDGDSDEDDEGSDDGGDDGTPTETPDGDADGTESDGTDDGGS